MLSLKPTDKYIIQIIELYGKSCKGNITKTSLSFQSVDRDRSGGISAEELKMALLNNNWSHFNSETCRLMIGMFDKDRYEVVVHRNH